MDRRDGCGPKIRTPSHHQRLNYGFGRIAYPGENALSFGFPPERR
jgi:hypothetical protein